MAPGSAGAYLLAFVLLQSCFFWGGFFVCFGLFWVFLIVGLMGQGHFSPAALYLSV